MSVDLSQIKPGDIIQVTPDGNWGGCLVVVTELKTWGIQGFTPMPPSGSPAYIRIEAHRIEATGGAAQFVPAGALEHGDV